MGRTLLILSLFFLAMETYAQDSLEVDSFIIVKEFVPTLSQSSKIRVNPEINDTFKLEVELKYEFLDKHIPNTYFPDTIKAATLKGEPLVKLYRNYAIVGYGNYNTPMAEFYYNQLRSKKTSLNVYGRHLSSNGIGDIENSGFSHNTLGINANRYSHKFTYNGKVNYGYDDVNYYGYSQNARLFIPGGTEKNENIGQFYNKLNAKLSLANNQRDTIGLRHFSELEFNYISDGFQTSETRFVLAEELNKIHNKEIYTFSWAVDYNNQQLGRDNLISDYSNENTMLYVQPGIQLKGSKWKLDGALNLAFDFNDKTDVFLYPILDFRYNLIKSIIVPYVGVSGHLKRNSYSSFVNDNPFISSGVKLRNTNETFKGFAGIRGNLSKNTSFNVSFSQSNVRNMPLYVKDTLAEHRTFEVVYDEVNLTMANVEFMFEPAERWRFVLAGSYFIYEVAAEEYAWHKPDYHFSLLTRYDLQKKISVELLAYVIGSQKARTYVAKQYDYETLKGTVDLNLNFEYRYSKKIGLFLHLNNLAAIQYEKWQDYPTQSFSVMGGFKFSF